MSTTRTPATHQRQDTRERFAFTRIEIDRAPGISPGFAIEHLSPELNIIFGPNASGKSTTARAIQTLIWPHPGSLRGHHLLAEFDLGTEHWEIDADTSKVSRSQDGEPAEAPVVAPIDDRARYALSLHDLLASENQPMAQAILKESSGGFDLDLVAEQAGYRAEIPPRLESTRNVESALARLRDAERAQGEVSAQARHLGPLREQERESRQARVNAEAIRKAIHLAHVRNDLEAAREHLASMPQELAQATGDEPDRVSALNTQLADLNAKRAELERNRDQALADRDKTQLAGTTINEGVIAAIREEHEALGKLDAELTALQRDVKSAISERESHQRRLAADLSDAQMASLDTDGIRELAVLAHAYEEIRVRRRARDEVEQWIGTVVPPENVDDLRSGVEALSKRLQNPNREEAGALIGRTRMAAYVGGLLVIASAIWLANFVSWPWILLAVLGVAIIFFAWKYALPESVQEAEAWEARYRELELPEPATWTIPAVRERMNELQQELRVALVEQEKSNRWASLEQERANLDRAYTEIEARRSVAVARYGVAPDLKGESLRLLAENLGRWQGADSAVRSTETRLGQVRSERQTREHELREGLSSYGYEDPDFDEHIEHLDQRYQALQDAHTRAESQSRELENTIVPEIERYEVDRSTLFRQIGLEPGQEATLRERIDQLPAYREAQQAVTEREQAVREAWNALSLTPELREIDPADLQNYLAEAESTSGRLDDVLHEIGEIRTRISDAKKRHDIEAALGQRDDTLHALRHDRENLSREVTGQMLLTFIQHETRDAAMPIVFHRARELFSIITRGRYELEFEEGPPPAFTARDTSTGVMLHLDQLSSGTRVQVLMAIRLAFVENVENGPKLPVLLDETLGNSDELRAGAIIDSAIEIVRKGRQVFYFTAQGDEVARWQARLDQLPEGERPVATIVDLGEVRRDAGFERLPKTALQAVQDKLQVTPPDGMDRESYAALIKASGLDPWMEGSGGVHLWHVIDDLPVLHGLLEQDIVTWGQLSGIARSNGSAGLSRIGVNEAVFAHAGAKIRLIETAVTLWRIGHDRPVSLREIANSGIAEDHVLDELGAILSEAGNNGATLIEALRTSEDSPLSPGTIDELERWLIGEGYISQADTMSPSEVQIGMVQASEDDFRRDLLTEADVTEVVRQLFA